MEHEGDGNTNYNLCSWHSHQRIGPRTRELGNKGTKEDHPNYSIIKIGQNTEKCPGDLRRLAANAGVKNSKRKTIIMIVFWGFEIRTDYLIQARRLDLQIINKKKLAVL